MLDCNVNENEARMNLVLIRNQNATLWQRYVVQTGNIIMDQFQPWYFGVAFAFCFKYCTGMPDMPAFAKRPRHRRVHHHRAA